MGWELEGGYDTRRVWWLGYRRRMRRGCRCIRMDLRIWRVGPRVCLGFCRARIAVVAVGERRRKERG